MTDGSSLYTLNTTSGTATLVGAHGIGGFSGLAFVPAPGAVALLVLSGFIANRRRK